MNGAAVDGRTVVHDAALDNDTDGLLALLGNGADVDAADSFGAVPLHLAAHSGALGALEVLLGFHAIVDVEDHNGNTPLMIAVTTSNDDTRLVRALVAAGADPGRRNAFGRTPAGMARLLGHDLVERLLAA